MPYNHPGPAHLSIGQEAAAVGQAYLLIRMISIFGSPQKPRRNTRERPFSHSEAARRGAYENNEKFRDGIILKIVEKYGQAETVKELAIDFLVYGAIAEIFARETGFQAGLGGSMHAFFTPFGIYPNNAIVGGSADIAVGAALYKKVNRKKGIVIANIGDGGPWMRPCMGGLMPCCDGPVQETLGRRTRADCRLF